MSEIRSPARTLAGHGAQGNLTTPCSIVHAGLPWPGAHNTELGIGDVGKPIDQPIGRGMRGRGGAPIAFLDVTFSQLGIWRAGLREDKKHAADQAWASRD